MRSTLVAIVLTASVLAGCQTPTMQSTTSTAPTAVPHGDVHWAYGGEAGPANWGKLDEKFEMCSIGRNQSPIDIATSIKAELKPLRFDYVTGATGIQNNGHSVQVDYAPGSTVTVDGKAFMLTQFHFHSPSENTFNGKRFPMEGHFVHSDKDGNLAVVAVMYEEGASNASLAGIWGAMPTKAGDKCARRRETRLN
jgi:carbonic anhydrase